MLSGYYLHSDIVLMSSSKSEFSDGFKYGIDGTHSLYL